MKAQQEYESSPSSSKLKREKLNRFIAALAAVIQETDENQTKTLPAKRTMKTSSLFRCFPTDKSRM